MSQQVRILMDLEHVGEFASRVVKDFAWQRGIDLREEDYMEIASSALTALRTMFDRADFARSVCRDLDNISVAKES